MFKSKPTWLRTQIKEAYEESKKLDFDKTMQRSYFISYLLSCSSLSVDEQLSILENVT